MSRQDELKKTLQQLKDGTIDAAAASQQLEGMFKQIESDMGKIKDASGAPGEGLETAIICRHGRRFERSWRRIV